MWKSEMVRILRYLINDLDVSPTYSDDRLEETLLVASQFVINDVSFSVTYSVDVDECSLSPDPTSAPKDNPFINLACLKAACIIDRGVFRDKARQAGILIKSGSEQINTTGMLDGYKHLLDKGYCAVYAEAKKDFLFGGGTVGEAIITPFSSPNVYTGSNFLPRGIY